MVRHAIAAQDRLARRKVVLDAASALFMAGDGRPGEGRPGKGRPGRRADKVAAFLDAYVDHVERHLELLRLDALGYGVLDTNLEPARLRAFKLAFVARLAETATIVDHATRLSPGRGASLLTRSFALTRGLWQSSPPGEPAATEADAAPAVRTPDFGQELREASAEYWRGALGGKAKGGALAPCPTEQGRPRP